MRFNELDISVQVVYAYRKSPAIKPNAVFKVVVKTL